MMKWQPRLQTHTIVLGASMLALAACGQESFEEAPPGALMPCENGDQVEHYDFEQMSGNLQLNPELVKLTGLEKVDSCPTARIYTEKLNLAMDQIPEEALAPTAAGPESVSPKSLDGIATTSAAIKNADATNQSTHGVVEVGSGCTGVLISERAILTAAHCVDQIVAPNRNGYANLRISRYTPSEVQVFNGQVRINVHPNYSGDGDTADDIAVVKLFPPATFGFSSSHRTRIYTGLGSTINSMRLYGRGFSTSSGTGSSVLRWMRFTPSWWGPYHYLNDAGDARVCNGDSGGPTIDWTPSGFRVVAGLHSNSEKNAASGRCAARGGKQRSVRLQRKISWIEDMLDVHCQDFTDGGWEYVRCW